MLRNLMFHQRILVVIDHKINSKIEIIMIAPDSFYKPSCRVLLSHISDFSLVKFYILPDGGTHLGKLQKKKHVFWIAKIS